MKTRTILLLIFVIVNVVDGSPVDPEILDAGRQSMIAVLDALIEGNLEKAKSYASKEILESIEVYERYEDIFTGKEKIVDYQILEVRGYVCVDEPVETDPPISVHIIQYRLSGYDDDCYGLVIWVYRDKKWQFVSFPSASLADFPFKYESF